MSDEQFALPGETDLGLSLSRQDQQLLDALVQADFNIDAMGPLTAEQLRRATAISRMFTLLEDYPVEDGSDTLLHATMARIDRYESKRASRLRLPAEDEAAPVAGGVRRRFWSPDFISIAAVLLIAASVIWPILANVRQQSIDSGCDNNLRQMAYAFGQYAGDYNGAIPTAHAGLQGTWDKIHNVVNLQPLFDGGYCDHKNCQCPGIRHDHASELGYSYQWQKPSEPIRWGATQYVTILLGDRNPVIDAWRSGQFVPALTVSLNHGGRGQFVLKTDGATMWLKDPVVGRDDRIWMPGQADRLNPGLQPASAIDVFLAH